MSQQPSIHNSDARAEISQIEHSHVSAFNVPDLDAVLSCFAEDISGFSSTHNDRYYGRDALRKTFEYYLQKSEKVYYEVHDLEIHMLANGEAAFVTFYWEAAPLEGVNREVIKGRATHIFEHRDGHWQIVHEHFSRAH